MVLDTVDVYLQRIRSVDGPPSGNGVMASEADEALFVRTCTTSPREPEANQTCTVL